MTSALALSHPRPLRVRRKRHMRRSLVEALLRCPMYRPGNSEATAFGAALHDAIAEYLNTCVARREESLLDLEIIRGIARAAFFRVARGIDPGRWDDFLAIFDEWAHTHTADLATLYGVEQFLEVETDLAFVNGTMDVLRRLDDGEPSEPPTIMQVVDWKSQFWIEAHTFQLRCYAGIICLTWDTVEEVVTVADHFRRKSGVVSAVYSRAECLEWWGDVVLYGLGRYFANPKRIAVGGAQCERCDRRRTCGAALDPWKTLPATDEEAVALYGDWRRVREVVKIHRAGLKAFTDGREPLHIGAQDVGWMLPLKRRLVCPSAAAVRDHLNGPVSRRGDEVTELILDADELTQDEIDELSLAQLVRWDPGKLEFKDRKRPEKGDEMDPPPDPSGITSADREE